MICRECIHQKYLIIKDIIYLIYCRRKTKSSKCLTCLKSSVYVPAISLLRYYLLFQHATVTHTGSNFTNFINAKHDAPQKLCVFPKTQSETGTGPQDYWSSFSIYILVSWKSIILLVWLQSTPGNDKENLGEDRADLRDAHMLHKDFSHGICTFLWSSLHQLQ